MNEPGPSQPPSERSTSENPIKAVGRKVKSVLTVEQKPSVRILRQPDTTKTRRLHKGPAENVPDRGSSLGKAQQQDPEKGEHLAPPAETPSRRESVLSRFRNSVFGGREDTPAEHDGVYDNEYDQDAVDFLDVVDPEVATLSTLTNVQNSLFVPSLGKVVNRRPAYRISDQAASSTFAKLKAALKPVLSSDEEDDEKGKQPVAAESPQRMSVARSNTITSTLTDSQYAVLPHGERLEGWTHEEKLELNDLVRHQLHSRRAKFERAMRGFKQYVRRPFGLFITVYATLITLFGAAWVLFLIGWISLGSKQSYVVNIVDNVLVALFAVIGDGLAPFRAVDTYHMAFIAYYHRKTWKKRERMGLPKLADRNDLPDQRKDEVEADQIDLESLVARKMPRRLAKRVTPMIPKRIARRMITRVQTDDPQYEYTVLTPEEQARLEHHERKFSKSHTFYKPHETETHYAFPLKLVVAIVILLDFHSMLQISLGACTWGINYRTRPFALTTVILCCSITCNIMGGVLISVGDKRTRKKEVIERMMRQQLTSEAIDQMETRWLKEAEERGEIDKSVRKRYEEERDRPQNEEIKKSWKNVPNLPKVLLGKGEDTRQPSLPQKARGSTPRVDRTATGSSESSKSAKSSKNKQSKDKTNSLPPLQEHPAPIQRPSAALRKGPKQPDESKARKALRMIRRADLDRS